MGCHDLYLYKLRVHCIYGKKKTVKGTEKRIESIDV